MKFIKFMFIKRLFLLISILLLLNIIFSSVIVSAHSPSDMSLSFDTSSKELQVEITHQVSDPNTHYVASIIISINGEIEIKREYESQSGNKFTYTFTELEAIEGNDIQVIADCNQGGSITKQLTVGSGETPISEDEDDGGSTPGFEFLILMISLILIVFILRKRR